MEMRFLPLLLVVLLATLVPLILARFRRIPVVVGEIVAGIIIGPSVLGWVQGDNVTLDLLAEIGFAFLMFLSGLEIDFSILFAASKRERRQGMHPLTLAVISFVLTFILALGVSFELSLAGFIRDPWMMTLILSTTSLGIVVPVLKERGLVGSRLGQAILLSALLADFLTMFMITVYVTIRSTGLTLEILLIGLLFIPAVFLYQFGMRHLNRPSVRRLLSELSDATSQIKVRGAFALMVAFVVLAELVNAELILGAFLGGALASLLSGADDENLRHKLDAIGFGFFIPLFFVVVGIRFDLQAFLHDSSAWVLAPILLLAAFSIKLVSALIFRVSFSWRDSVASGMLLSSRLSLIIAASAIGLGLGLISESVNAAIILIAALTATFAPLLFNAIVPDSEDKRPRIIVIYGSGDLAIQVARELRGHGENVTFVEPDPLAADRLHKVGFSSVVCGEDMPTCLDNLIEGRVEVFLALGDSDEANYNASRSVCARGGYSHVVAYVTDPSLLSQYRALGVQVMTPSLHRSALLALMARNPALFDLLTSTADAYDSREVILSNPVIDGKRLSDVHLPGDVRLLAIRRDDELIVPHGGTRLVLGDHLSIVGSIDSLAEMRNWLNGAH